MRPGRDSLASLGTPERLGDLPLLPMPAGAPIFEQTLEYFSPQHAQPRYAGNIAETSWRRGNAEADTYAYTYDRLGRLVDSRIICSGTRLKFYGERDISYDKNTNILSLTRYNGLLTGTQYRYTYDGNRKLSVTSGASAETATDYGYQYDIMGNISKIGAENLLISYNYLNLPKQVTKMWAPRTEGAATYVVGVARPTVSYLYLADGTKVQAIGETGQGYEYVGSLRLSVSGNSVDVESIPFAGGRIVKTTNGYEPQYYITDHLGSTRTIVKPNATVVAEFDYMPYGTQHAVAGAPISEADYKYTGKEQQGAFGLDNLYDSQARFQYVTDGSFMSHDDLAEQVQWLSPYNYCAGNPINIIDPYGLNNYYLNADGTISLDGEYNEDDEYDFLYVAGNRKKSIRVKGSQFLYDLSQQRTDYDGHVAITDNKDQAFKVFKFVADNSNVEWGIDGYRTSSGSQYALYTSHEEKSVTKYGGFNWIDQIFDMHSHHGPNATAGGSGIDASVFVGKSDALTLDRLIGNFINAGMANNYTWFAIDKAVVPSSFTYAKLPAHYVYHVSSSSLYYYNKLKGYRGNNYYIRTIKQSRDLYRNLGF